MTAARAALAKVPACDYAACRTVAVYGDEGWNFCWQHYREHRADLHGEAWPALKPVGATIVAALQQGCGSEAALRRHNRADEHCEVCLNASWARRNPQGGVVRRYNARRTA